jgi:hypothetical protein
VPEYLPFAMFAMIPSSLIAKKIGLDVDRTT